ncbi:MAG: nucleotide-binding protein [Altererythrobacter sp.]
MPKIAKPESNKKRTRVSQSDVPAYSLDHALRVAEALVDNYASQPAKPLEVAAAMDMSPSSGPFRMLTGASIAYGLTEGGYNASEIALTDLGRRVTSPLIENDDLTAKREALLRPKVVGDFLRKYSDSPLPPENIAHNVLGSMGVPPDRAAEVYELIVNGASSLGLLQEIKGKKYVNLDKAPSRVTLDAQEDESNDRQQESDRDTQVAAHVTGVGITPEVDGSSAPQPNRKVFITHGKNKGFVEPIKKLLKFGELEAVVSVEKQSVSQPVPEKVMSDMRSCGAAIIHVQGEQVLMDQDANEHIVLNPNVLIEIGAAMALYGKRFILLVKEGTKMPSNLQGLYEVRYEGDTLDGAATIRLLEAINEMKAASST